MAEDHIEREMPMLPRDAAFQRLMQAAKEYNDLSPPRPEPTEPPLIVPTLKHCNPNNFHLGLNMYLDAGGHMPGKIPVVVVPARPADLRRYRSRRTVRALLATLKLT